VRVLYTFPHPIGRPGIGTTAFHQVEGLAEHGAEVVLMCTNVVREPQGVSTTLTTLEVGGIRIPHRAIGVDRAYRVHDRRVAARLRRLVDIDLVHVWPTATLATARAASPLGIPVFREVPNTHTAYAFETVARELDRLGMTPIAGHSHTFDPRTLAREEAEYDAADVLLMPSEFSRRTFLDRGLPAEKLVLHQYGYDARRFFPSREGRPAARPLTVLFAGRCEPRKGLHYALEAWLASGAAEGGTFLICGDFVPGYREAVAPLLDHPSVQVRGFVDDMAAVMRDSDVLILPSVEEGSALVTYEAQACGSVLAVSDAAGARCEHLEHGLVHAAGDVAALTEHLRLLASDGELLARLRAASLARIEELTWSRAGRLLVEAYERHLAASSGRGRRVYA
jgi:D-inositol-3-phosphate glycosyltransferase